MFSLLYCFAPVFLGFYHLYVIKKRNSIIWHIKKGEICYHCKQSLGISNDIILGRLLDTKDFSQLCVSCNRNKKLDQIKRPYLNWRHKFYKFLISGKLQMFNFVFIILVFSTIVLDLVLLYSGYKFRLWPVYGTMNLIFYFVTLYKTFYTTTKKPSE